MTSPLDPSSSNRIWEKEKEREKEKRWFLESVSNFSLDFPVIGPSNSGESRGKVTPHSKSYAWVPVLCSFDKLRKVGVFSYLVIPCLKSHEMVLDVVRPEMTMDFGSKEVEPMLDEGLCPWTAHGQIWDC